MRKFYTIGMAGHIDHGKTTLTKALTGVETDRLKEEKLRQISIEPGFAPLVQTDNAQISIIDVPGHERFIRQMIAGVAGIDFVVLVIAADEGVMPQTKEHLHILSLLGIDYGAIAITKIAHVDEELLDLIVDDIRETVEGTFLECAPLYFVDSVSNQGVEAFKMALIDLVKQVEKRPPFPSFRLPIDHVFTVKGQGVVVRGTVFDGHTKTGDELRVIPSDKHVRVRQIQSHHEQIDVVYTGQRAAINIGGITHDELTRGDVLVKDDFYTPTTRIDVSFTPLAKINYPIKQRQLIKLYVGTSEVTGKIIFYDRNVWKAEDASRDSEILCQLQLDEEVVVTRGDRFIVRRATPIETLGGGWVMDPNGAQRRFGEQSIESLRQIKDGSAEERINRLLEREHAHTEHNIKRLAPISAGEFAELEVNLISIGKQLYTTQTVVADVTEAVEKLLHDYHKKHPLHLGMNKAELVSELSKTYSGQLIEFTITQAEARQKFEIDEQIISLISFTPTYPAAWAKRIEQALAEWEKHGADVEKMEEYFTRHQIAESLHTDLYYYLLHSNEAYLFDEGRLISRNAALLLRDKLYKETQGQPFTLQIAREAVKLSRKNLVPLLELFDQMHLMKRKDNERVWLISSNVKGD